jgi:hypothetical protein
MQSTTRVHDGIANAIRQEASLVFHHTVAFHTANGVFDTDADGRDRTIGRLLRWGECTTREFFLGLEDRDPIGRIALEPPILIEATATWEGRGFQISQAFIMRLPFIGGTQEAHATGLLDHEEGFDRVALLLATLVFRLVLGIGGAVDRPFSAIMPNRGGPDATFVRSAASRTAQSSAVRAGSNSGWAQA